MKKTCLTLGRILTSAVITLIGGWVLAHVIVDHVGNMPYFMDRGIRTALRVTGNESFANTDDIETLGLFTVLAASLIIVGVVVVAANVMFGRYQARDRTAH